MMNIAEVIAAEGADGDVAEFVRRLTFNVLIGNGDMHIKNWSVVYPDRRNAALSPAYDFVSTIPYLNEAEAALTFSRTKRFDGYSEDELKHMAARARLPETLVVETARETAALFHQHWQAQKAHLPLAQIVIDAIETHLKTVPVAG
jgi:serine/threonine-protein kinase HipA